MAVIQFLTKTHFDYGAILQIPAELDLLKVARPLIATDEGIKATGILQKILDILPDKITPTVFTETPSNPTEEKVDEAFKLYTESDCDGVICIGGGSSIDLGKAVALLATHEGPVTQYALVEGGAGKIQKTAPLIAVPTTAGTGSEVSVGSVIISNDGRKLTIANDHLIPDVAICDPELTLGLPKYLTAATGMDAVTHCIEAILTNLVNPPAEGIGYDGLERAIREGNLERAVADGSDKEARWNMMMASTEGAMAFVKSLGSVHAMSHACGRIKELNLHHGTLNAVILPSILRFNEGHTGNKYERLRRSMGLKENQDIAEFIEGLNERIGLPASLGEMGVTEAMLPELVQHSVTDVMTYTNPRPVSPEEYESLFKGLI